MKGNFYDAKRFNFQLDLAGETMHATGRSDVDFVVLNEASPLLVYEVVRSGRLIYERQHDARVTFEAHAVQRYLDFDHSIK